MRYDLRVIISGRFWGVLDALLEDDNHPDAIKAVAERLTTVKALPSVGTTLWCS